MNGNYYTRTVFLGVEGGGVVVVLVVVVVVVVGGGGAVLGGLVKHKDEKMFGHAARKVVGKSLWLAGKVCFLSI